MNAMETGAGAPPPMNAMETGAGAPPPMNAMETGAGEPPPLNAMETGAGAPPPLATLKTGEAGPPALASLETADGPPAGSNARPSAQPMKAPVVRSRSGQSSVASAGAVAPLPPELAQRFETLRLLGKGGMGVVTLCRDRQLNREIAVKVMIKHSDRLEALLRQEATTLASLEHENIVRLYDIGTAAGLPYLVMEFVRGNTLSGRLAERPVTVMESVKICRDMARGIAAAHARGIIHFDIKPGNIFLDEGGRAKVADFGLAQVIAKGQEDYEEGSTFYYVGGTPAYMAPEQRYGAAGKPADVYACGVVLNELLTGRPTFPGRSDEEMRYLKMERPLVRPSSVNPRVPAVLDELVLSCLDPKPGPRPTIESFSKSLEDWLDRVTNAAHRASGSSYPAHPYRFLEWFDVQDAPIFFGRDAETQELTELLSRPQVRLVTLFGPCGIGKSSIMRAGLARAVDPNVQQLFVLIGGPNPARRVLELIAARAVVEGVKIPGVDEEITADLLALEPRRLPQVVADLNRITRKWLVIVLDQTEEVFTQNPADAPPAGELFALVRSLVEDTSLAVKFVIAYRTEFRGDFFPLEQRLQPHLMSFPLGEIQESGLVEAIEGPSLIEHYDFGYDTGLPRTLAKEILASARANRTSALPTLQIICRQLYDRMREGKARLLTYELFEKTLGGAKGALQRYVESRLADPVYAHQGAVARQMLEALTVKDGERERFSNARDEVEVLDFPDKQQAMQTLDQLIADRLVVRDLAEGGRRMVRLTSEVICPTIDAWTAAPDPAQVAARLLARSHRLWVEANRAPEGLLTPRQIAQITPHLTALRGISDEEKHYVELSQKRARRQRVMGFAVATALFALSGILIWAMFFRPGALELASDPPGATVSLGAERLGETPFKWSERPGVYTLKISRPDHDPVEVPVRLQPGGLTQLSQFLPYQRGTLQIFTDPPGARCSVAPLPGTSGTPAVLRTPFTTEVMRGAYALTVSLPGYETRTLPEVRVQGNRKLTNEVVKLVRNAGWVLAPTPRTGSSIVLSDAKTGRTVKEDSLPLKAPLSLDTGTYLAEIKGKEGMVDFQPVEVSARTTSTVSPWIPALAALWEVRGFTCVNPAGAADLDGDDRADMVFPSREGQVTALSGLSGSVLWSYRTGGPILMSPQLADLGRDGVPDAVVTSHDGLIHAIDGRTGAALWTAKIGSKAQSNPAFTDLNGDGALDVIAGSLDRTIHAVDGRDGKPLWTYPTGGAVYSDPRAVDLTGDGVADVVCGSDDRKVHAVDGKTGKALWTYPTAGEVGVNALVTRLDADAVPDVFVLSADHIAHAISGRTGQPLWTAKGAAGFDGQPGLIGDVNADGVDDFVAVGTDFHRVQALSGKDGRVLWTHLVSGTLWPLILTGDQAADGQLAILVAGPGEVLVIDAKSGRPRWGIELGKPMTASPSWADLDGDGALDIVHVLGKSVKAVAGGISAHRWAFQTESEIRCQPALMTRGTTLAPDVLCVAQESAAFRLDGASGVPRWRFEAGTTITSDVGAGDLDGDGELDALIGTTTGVTAISGRTGQKLWAHPAGQVEARPGTADFDGDGRLDVAVGTNGRRVLALSGRDGAPIWEHPTAAEVAADPLCADLDGDGKPDVAAAALSGAVYALGQGGKLLWERRVSGAVKCPLALAPLASENLLIVASEDGAVTAFTAQTGQVRWIHRAPVAIRAGPAVSVTEARAKQVIVGDSDGRVRALDAATGQLIWVRITGNPGGMGTQPASLADLDADGVPDAVLAHAGVLIALSGADGRELYRSTERFTGFRHPQVFASNLICGTTTAIVRRRLRLAPRPSTRSRSRWIFATGAAATPASTIAQVDGRATAFTASADGGVYAVGADGARRWRFEAGSPVVVAPLVLPGAVVAASSGGTVWALGAADGQPVWSAKLAAEPVAATTADADADGTPDVLIALRGGSFAALSGKTGAPLWSKPIAPRIAGQPAIADLDGDGAPDVLVPVADGQLVAFAAKDGRALWSDPPGTKGAASPVVADGIAYCPSGKSLAARDAKDGKERWRVEVKADLDGPPLVAKLDGDDVPDVVVTGRDGSVFSFSGASGAPLWQARLGARATARALRPPGAGAPTTCLFGAGDGLVHALDAASGQRIWVHAVSAAVIPGVAPLADVDGDGTLDVLAGCEDGSLHAVSGRATPSSPGR